MLDRGVWFRFNALHDDQRYHPSSLYPYAESGSSVYRDTYPKSNAICFCATNSQDKSLSPRVDQMLTRLL